MSVSADSIRIGQKGTVITSTITQLVGGVSVAVDLSGTNLVQLEFEKPNGLRVALITASILNPPGTNGKITYRDTVGIFDIEGRWKVRGVATFINGDFFPGSWTGFPVAE